ncbi:hypothetical protein CJD35_18735 (plasmid) [Sphingobium xenophagum]|jgi:tellurite resistance-related uncharacterized protein|uniref:TehB/YeaR-like domain-containing protein n=2 Tax=Sphingomonadaceae TaxID=41297 RepID=A0A249MYY9_SPHXE|nr:MULTISPECIES: DUF1971 domain-containing protein [Sphingomonadaceae]ASY46526.1 hypothetical protein CJD35_18735 [Sphingobium xenophagum]MBJ7438467.1 DUF1971 domain-containing protein [Sphingopyxis sp.]BBF72597.1 hypothetical protein SBA_pBAR3_1640 [Sphingomonas bisphenolicum]
MPEPFRSTPVFDQNTIPARLRGNHRTKVGVWGVIRVLEGSLNLTYVEPHSQILLTQEVVGVVKPDQPHFVTPLGNVRMQVDFYHEPPKL